jgi:hypothetical protein
MGLAGAERKELESLIKAAAKGPAVPIGLARRMVPRQGDIEEFAYGLISGMVLGNFLSSFERRNGRRPDRDESADIMSVMMARMPVLRKAIMKQLELR